MRRVRFRDDTGSIRMGNLTDRGIEFGGNHYDMAAIDVLSPSAPSKIVCVGRNYLAHAAELDNVVPDRPLLFLKGPNTVAGHRDTLRLPSGKDRIDHEAELAVVIGEQCRNVPASNAESVIAGYTCLNDISNRDDQNEETNWIRGKAFDHAAPMGPVLATPDEVSADAGISLRVNGEVRQDASIADMHFSVPALIEEITAYITLEPGDVIATGTPDGVGPLEDGDTVEVEIDGIGVLENEVVIPENENV